MAVCLTECLTMAAVMVILVNLVDMEVMAEAMDNTREVEVVVKTTEVEDSNHIKSLRSS